MSNFQNTFSYKLIYIFRINDEAHKNLMKIGDATIDTNKSIDELTPSCRELNLAAKKRIDSYTRTASIEYELLYTELALRTVIKNGVSKLEAFRDKKVQNVLTRSGIKKHEFNIENQGIEWYETDLDTAKNAIKAVKDGRNSLNPQDISEDNSPIIFRPEQKKAIKDTISQFKVSDRMLWNAKMRFGKTLTALEVAKEIGFRRTLIFTHRPVVSDGWFDDFNKIFKGTNYKFGSKTKGERIENLVDGDAPYVYFASIQDLRGSQAVGGKFDKNDFIFLIDWDYVIVDEAHEGTQTTLGQRVIETILSNDKKAPKLLELSGTPFNLLRNFKEHEIYTWDYIMEQKAKQDWPLTHFGDSNPYEELPKLEIYTYNLEKYIKGYIDEDSAFNFREFFKTWTGNVQKDYKMMPANAKIGDFVHKDDVWAFLNLLTKEDDKSNYPFSKEEYRNFYRHTLWMVPGVKEARALSKMLQSHPVFSQFNIVNVAGEGDEETDYENALAGVRKAITDQPDECYSITISCGRLTTGVTVPEWTAVFMLAGSFSTSASSYLQTIFRVQTPANVNGKIKERCSVFDFAPDRALKMAAEAGNLSSKAGKISDKIVMGDFLNFCPVVSVEGSNMKPYDVDGLLQQLKKAYTDRVVKNGFDDRHLYNENLLKLNDIELKDFEELKKIVGSSKQTEKTNDIDINNQGFTQEEYEELQRIERKPKKELTPADIAFLEEKKKKRDNAQKAMSILRGISIRIPLLIYGADVPENKEITVDNFVDIVDDVSWSEFMPTGVTKSLYKKFSKYYEEDVFIGAGRQIRNLAKAADDLSPTERVIKISQLFTMFKNPDKETVLTPWRVVNMHMGDCLGGYNFYNENYTEIIDEPRFVDCGKVTDDTLANTNGKILEINSKTGLYPLYVVYSIYRAKLDKLPKEKRTLEKQNELWLDTVQNNMFIICKTPMAKSITKRTLLGYRRGKINAHAFDDLINQLRDKPQQFTEKVTRGNFWNKEEKIMKFDAVVGNPPYQENLDNRSEQPPIYHLFYSAAFKLSKKVSLITPARFLFNAGKTPKDWNKKILSDVHFKVVDYIENSKEIFPTVEIKGGIAVTFRNEDENFGAIGVYVKNNIVNEIVKKVRESSIKFFDQIIFSNTSYKYSKKLFEEHPEFLNRLSGGSARYLSSSVFDKLPEIFYKTYPRDGKKYVKIIGRQSSHRAEYFIRKDYISPPPNFNKYKVFISSSNGSGEFGEILTAPFVGEPDIGATETFVSFGSFDDKQSAKNLIKYLKTKFARTLLGTLKVTQGNKNSNVWANVAVQDFAENSDIDWSKTISEIDQQLYNKYNLSKEEINFIETNVKPME